MNGQTQPLIERTTGDGNFASTVSLIGSIAVWAETIEVGHQLTHNDRNMVQIPVELALAFVRHHASDQSALGDACRASLDQLAAFRAVRQQQEPAHAAV